MFSVKPDGAWILMFLLQAQAYRLKEQLPRFMRTCEINSELPKCAREAVEQLRPYLAKGIPELKIPPIDPLLIPHFYMANRNSHIANYHANITNLVWSGVKEFQIEDIFVDPAVPVFRIRLRFPKLSPQCFAFVKGTVLSFNIDSVGGGTADCTNVVIDIVLNGRRYAYKGKEYIKWKKEDIDISFEDAYFINLFGFFKDPTLMKLFHIALNKGIRLVGSSFRKPIEHSIGHFVMDTINRIHKIYPLDMLYSAP